MRFAAGNVDQIGDHRAGCGAIAGPRALKQQPAGEIAFGNDRVGRAVDMRQRVRARNQARPDALQQALDQGEDAKLVWRAVCDATQAPASER